MTVRRQITLCFALVAIGLSAGCGGGDSSGATPEIDDPYYRQGQQLVKQGRTQEALASYLKAIAHRGEMSSAESHLEAGVIYLQHSQDPVEAYHHFRQYLSQQPNSRDSARVRQLLETSKRELFRTLVGQPVDNPGARELLDKIENLQRTNDALRAELEAMRNSANAPIVRQTRTPLTIEPPVVRSVVPETPSVISTEEPSPITPVPATSRETVTVPNPAPARPVPTRPAAPTSMPSTTATRRHMVVQGDTLFGLTKKYYGAASAAKADAIYEANRDVMKSKSDLRPGMEIKIP